MPSKPNHGVEKELLYSEDRSNRPSKGRGTQLGLILLALMLLASGVVFAAEGSRNVSDLGADLADGPAVEPISSIGHGAFFDPNGKQIVPTEDFVRGAQEWYRKHLVDGFVPEQKAALDDFESRLVDGLNIGGQSGLLLQQRSLNWLLQRVPLTVAPARMRGKINALKVRLQWRLAPSDDLQHLRELNSFVPDAATLERLHAVDTELELFAGSLGGPGTASLVTTNDGLAYINECISHDVPIPPSIGVLDPAGTAGWKSLGFIPTGDQFIVGTPAEVRSFESADGMCIALPRYTNGTLSTVFLDGVICLSQITSKVCIWDNQMSGTGFNFASGDQIPIGVADLGVDPSGRYQGGGAELEFGSGGVCTDCHAGENPYIVHPNSNLGGGLLFGNIDNAPTNLPTFGPNRYDPIVAGSWAQNQLSQTDPFVPSACVGCHTLGGVAGRFPHLSDELPDYCNVILAQAITDTMPPGSPGSAVGTTELNDFLAWCGEDPTAGPSNRGDPHLKTVDGVSYDFQSAGEFTSLRSSSSGFELQTRQTAVTTTFNPGPNAYTGLSSCASLNTAAAVRLGEHRVSVQPSVTGFDCKRQRIVLYLDGVETVVPSGGIDLGNGNRIANITDGYEIRASDGTRVLITDHYWASQGYSYLNVEVLDTPAREGTMGTIVGNDWLPRAPDGSSYGPMPAGLPTRDFQLNMTFADDWRITNSASLFEYAPGTSTADFTDRSWPPPNGTPCDSWQVKQFPGCGPAEAVEPLSLSLAQEACSMFRQQEDLFGECVFDVQLMGNPQMAEGLAISLAAREAPCATCWPENGDQ